MPYPSIFGTGTVCDTWQVLNEGQHNEPLPRSVTNSLVQYSLATIEPYIESFSSIECFRIKDKHFKILKSESSIEYQLKPVMTIIIIVSIYYTPTLSQVFTTLQTLHIIMTVISSPLPSFPIEAETLSKAQAGQRLLVWRVARK